MALRQETSSRQPQSQCDYSPAACIPFLRNFNHELEEFWPDLHTFVHDNFVVHSATGKRTIADPTDIAIIEGPTPSASQQDLATPRRRRLTTPTTRSSTITKEQQEFYHLAPALVHKADKDLAAIILKCMSNSHGKEAIRKLLDRVDEDPGWFPGKSDQVKFGPSPVLNGAKRRCVATSAMALKELDLEPTYATVLAKCPRATVRSAVDVSPCLLRGFSLVPCSPKGRGRARGWRAA